MRSRDAGPVALQALGEVRDVQAVACEPAVGLSEVNVSADGWRRGPHLYARPMPFNVCTGYHVYNQRNQWAHGRRQFGRDIS